MKITILHVHGYHPPILLNKREDWLNSHQGKHGFRDELVESGDDQPLSPNPDATIMSGEEAAVEPHPYSGPP